MRRPERTGRGVAAVGHSPQEPVRQGWRPGGHVLVPSFLPGGNGGPEMLVCQEMVDFACCNRRPLLGLTNKPCVGCVWLKTLQPGEVPASVRTAPRSVAFVPSHETTQRCLPLTSLCIYPRHRLGSEEGGGSLQGPAAGKTQGQGAWSFGVYNPICAPSFPLFILSPFSFFSPRPSIFRLPWYLGEPSCL